MWLTKKKIKALEKRIADLEAKVQSQQEDNVIIINALIESGLNWDSVRLNHQVYQNKCGLYP